MPKCVLCGSEVRPPKAFICEKDDVDGLLDKAYRKSKSISTVESTKKSLDMLFTYTEGREGALKVVASKPNIYEWFDGYVAWLQSRGMRGGTVRNRVSIAKKWFKSKGVELGKEKFGEDVTMPKVGRIPDVPITPQMLKQALTGAPLDLMAYITIIASSGRRGGEVAQYKWSFVHLDEHPTRIIVPADITKTDLAQDVFISDESAEFVKQLKHQTGERDFVFYDQKTPPTERQIELLRERWNRWLDKVGLGQKLEGHPYRTFHPHSIGRKFFFSRVVGIIGETAAHALMGHSKWWMTYYQRPLEQRRADYMKAMPDLTIFKPEPSVEQRKQAILDKAVLEGWPKEAMEQLQKSMSQINWMLPSEELDLTSIAEQFAKHAKQESGPRFEIVQVKNTDEKTIAGLLADGFEFVDRVNGHRLYRRRV